MATEKKDSFRSSSHQREWQFYASPKYDHLLHRFRSVNEMGKSEAVNFIVRRFFEQMPKDELDRLLMQSKDSHNAL